MPILLSSSNILAETSTDALFLPASYYTLVLPYEGKVETLKSIGEIVQPLTDEVQRERFKEIVDYSDPAYREAQTLALAKVEKTPTELDNSTVSRYAALHDAFETYGLKQHDSDRPPWDFQEFDAKSRWAMSKLYASYQRLHSSNAQGEGLSHSQQILQSLKANGAKQRKDIREIWESSGVVEKIGEPLAIQLTERVVLFSIKRYLIQMNTVARDPYTADQFEPNNTELLDKDGVISLEMARQVDFRDDFYTPYLSRLRTYWTEAVESGIADINDRMFIDEALRRQGKAGKIGPADRQVVAKAIAEEARMARNRMYGAQLLKRLIYVQSIRPQTGEAEILAALTQAQSFSNYSSTEFPKSELPLIAKAIAYTMPAAAAPGTPAYLQASRPASNSTFQFANEIRASQEYKGNFLKVSERSGFLRWGESETHVKQSRLWTLELPLGGSNAIGAAGQFANREASIPATMRFQDIEQLFDLEIKAALGLSSTFLELSGDGYFDRLASALGGFDATKADTGRALRRQAETIREEQRIVDKVVAQRRQTEALGFFYVAEPSVVVKHYARIGDYLKIGAPLIAVRPLNRFRLVFSVKTIDRRFLVGANIPLHIHCKSPASSVSSVDSIDETAADKILKPNSVSVEITDITASTDQTRGWVVGGTIALPSKITDGAESGITTPKGLPAYGECKISY